MHFTGPKLLSLALLFVLAACASTPTNDLASRAAAPDTVQLPPMKAFSIASPEPPARANQDIARDFLELTFRLESGRVLERFSRFEKPISVRVIGNPPPTLMPDLKRLVRRLRNEAGIDIARVDGNATDATITIQAVPRSDIRRFLPKAACFVVPNISNLSEYRAYRNVQKTSWSEVVERTKIAIFLPSDSAPQEVRDCLHEELAQAIGPLNDLYRLPDSVFNDDNVHAVLTGFDMLILRAFYAPELKSGMTQQEVAARLPKILSRLNPRGDRVQPQNYAATPRAWIDAIQTALGPGTDANRRLKSASRALQIAQQEGWSDHRLAFSYFALGRLSQASDPEFALRLFVTAETIYRQTPHTSLHRAYSATQLAAYSISLGQGKEALALIDPHLATAKRHENAALLATLMMLRAEALELADRPAEARAVRQDSMGWARYGFGSDWAVRTKLNEISALSPLNVTNG